MNFRFFRFLAAVSVISFIATPALAATDPVPFAVRQAVVWVHCGNRQGSGVMVNAEKGYILTNGHILINSVTNRPDPCEVGFVTDATLQPTLFYEATWERYAFDESQNQDYAILKVGDPEQPETLATFPQIKTDEFSQLHDPITIVAYPSSSKGQQFVSQGTINGFDQGIIKTDAVISPGSSGGAGIDKNNNLIGIATRILYRQLSNGTEEVVDYELIDIRAILTWLDTFGVNNHDNYVTHADPARYHGPAALVTNGDLSCTMLARSPDATTVYCLRGDATRAVFPNTTTYHSWFADFSGVQTILNSELAQYRLTSNITMKPGSLVKVATDPKVYLVSDASGTLRWIPTETRAQELFGNGWAGFVKDVPDTFFTNYKVGAPAF